MSGTVARFDPLIHAQHRLRICAMLGAGPKIDFGLVQQRLGLSASALSKQVAQLVDAGYVEQQRSSADSRRIWLTLTASGRRAYDGHRAALQAIVDSTESVSDLVEQ